MTGRPRLYSYIRWSSEKQRVGSTLDRQLAQAHEVAERHGLELVEQITDEGVSAYKGRNAKDGALGDFIAAVEDGAIDANSWLVVENLDRISRAHILDAQTLLMNLLKLGLTIVTGMDGKVYSAETIKENPMDLMYSIMLFSRAHEESKTKAKRTNGSALSIIRKHQSGIRSEEGHALAIKAVGSNMWWVDAKGQYVKPHDYYWPIAQEVIEMMMTGMGSYRIKDYLDKTYDPPSKFKKGWSINALRKMAHNRALIGEKSIKVDGSEYTLDEYYPALLTEDGFYKLRTVKEANRSASTSKTKEGLVTGIKVAKCGHCGEALVAFQPARKKLRYICLGGQAKVSDCRAWSFNAEYLEDTLIRVAADKVWSEKPSNERSIDQGLVALRHELADKERQLENYADSIAGGTVVNTIVQRMAALEVDIAKLKADIDNYHLEHSKQQHAVPTGLSVEWAKVPVEVMNPEDIELRIKTKVLIKKSFKTIRAFKLGEGTFKFCFTFADGQEIEATRVRNKRLDLRSDIFLTDPTSVIFLQQLVHTATWGEETSAIPEVISAGNIQLRPVVNSSDEVKVGTKQLRINKQI